MIRVLACLALLVSLAPRVCPQQRQLYIRVNQIGFSLGGSKTAVIFGNEPLPSEFRHERADEAHRARRSGGWTSLSKGVSEPAWRFDQRTRSARVVSGRTSRLSRRRQRLLDERTDNGRHCF